jgi:hypothetical protein
MIYPLYNCLKIASDLDIKWVIRFIKRNLEDDREYFKDNKTKFEECKTIVSRAITEYIRKFPFKQPYKSHDSLYLDKSDTTDDHILPPQHIIDMILDNSYIEKYVYSEDKTNLINALCFATQTIVVSKKEHNQKIPKANRYRNSKTKYLKVKTLDRLKKIKLFCSDENVKSYVDDKSFYPAFFTEDFKNDLIQYDNKLYKIRPTKM